MTVKFKDPIAARACVLKFNSAFLSLSLSLSLYLSSPSLLHWLALPSLTY
jgi:hypothetical protein